MSHSKTNSFPYLAFTQGVVALNDNIVKYMLFGLAAMLYSADATQNIITQLSYLLILPFIILSPLAGWLADRFSKNKVIQTTTLAQSIGLVIIAIGLFQEHFTLLLIGFASLAIQSTFFSPAKQGILKEIVGGHKLGMAIGIMQLITIIAILFGNVLGGYTLKWFTERTQGNAWNAAAYTTLIVAAMALLSFLCSTRIQSSEKSKDEPFQLSLFWAHWRKLLVLRQCPGVGMPSLGIAFAWGLGLFFTLTLMKLGIEQYQAQAASHSSIWLLSFGIGTIIGSALYSYVSRRYIETFFIPLGILGLVALIPSLSVISALNAPLFNGALALTGISIVFFAVPLTALLQNRSPQHQRGQVIAASNFLTNIAFLLVTAIQWLLAQEVSLSAQEQILAATVPAILVAATTLILMPETLVRILAKLFLRTFYKTTVQGIEGIPHDKGALLICNHISYLDALVIMACAPRPVRFLSFAGLAQNPLFAILLRAAGTIPIAPKHAKEGIKEAQRSLASGEIVCIFPEGQLTRTGFLQGFQRGFITIARNSNCPIIPVFLDGLWGSIFSFYSQKYFFNRPNRLPYPISISFGQPLTEQDSADSARQSILDLGEQAYQARPFLQRHLADVAGESLSAKPQNIVMADHTKERKTIQAGTMLALSLLLARKIRKEISAPRVGIVLPPGIAGSTVNLAVSLAGKTPVNLNFSLGRQALEASMQQAEITTVITAQALRSRAQQFPWPDDCWDIAKILPAFSKAHIVGLLSMIHVLPWPLLRLCFRVPKQGDKEEAGLLFTSGSSGDPKGVVLSHRNILANCSQIADCGILPKGESLLACLPLFHSFGFTVTIWFTLIYNLKMVTVPSPLEIKKIATVIEEEQTSYMLGTPTFYRPYLNKTKPEQLRSLKGIVAGAEKTPEGLAQRWEKQFTNCRYLEGYGLTETSPVVSVNVPDPITPKNGTARHQEGSRAGSAGRIVPGMSVRILHNDTGEMLPMGEVGMIQLKGPNIFSGYLNNPSSTAECFDGDWFITGDLGYIDKDGFLFISGRLSRFSKIGGEMVPHGKIEEEIIQAFAQQESDKAVFALTARPDDMRGEALVLITTLPVTASEVHEKLLARGITNLWIPRIIKQVEEIPCLPTGKLDLKSCQNLALES